MLTTQAMMMMRGKVMRQMHLGHFARHLKALMPRADEPARRYQSCRVRGLETKISAAFFRSAYSSMNSAAMASGAAMRPVVQSRATYVLCWEILMKNIWRCQLKWGETAG